MIYFSEYPARYSSLQSFQPTEVHELSLVNEPRDAFTATYLLRRLNSAFDLDCLLSNRFIVFFLRRS